MDANLNSVVISLQAMMNLNNGYSKAEAGEIPIKCAGESLMQATEKCNGSKSGIIWQRYVWKKSGSARSNFNDLNDPTMATKGMEMISTAAASTETMMYAKSERGDGNGGNRHGLAQCTGDLGRFDGPFGLLILAASCFMMYYESQIYFGSSLRLNPAARDPIVEV
ncbi:hypothetical protein CDL12_13122 [Handroanthus impetiginosus]|uniref:Uncharacterized protein n=1 Tax=Handroanthus impetiginosus TaxID=429701 RepID=A0A2G9H9W6_9LAMI|nr:hypothetical protein CDL12_13122 [Handroanthus impetiginosus]